MAACLAAGVPAQTGDASREATLRQRFAEYQSSANTFKEATAALSERKGQPTQADWKPIIELRAPLGKLQQEMWDDYLAGPRDALGLEACMFLATQTQLDKSLVRKEVLEHYADEDVASDLASFSVSAMQLKKADVAFLRELLAASASPSVQVAARATLAESLHEMGTFLQDLDKFDSSIEDALLDMMTRAMRALQGMGIAPAADLETASATEELREAIRPRLPSMPLYAWKDSDPAALIAEAEALLDELAKNPPDTPVYRADFDSGRMEAVADTTAGALVAALETTIRASLIGRPSPELVATDYDGEEVRLAGLRGKVLLLDFWATWCAPCRAAMPGNDETAAKLAGRPFELVTLSVDRDVESARKFMQEQGYRFTNWYLGPQHPALASWRVTSYPTYVVVDDLGVVQSIPRVDHAALERYLEKLVRAAEARGAGGQPVEASADR